MRRFAVFGALALASLGTGQGVEAAALGLEMAPYRRLAPGDGAVDPLREARDVSAMLRLLSKVRREATFLSLAERLRALGKLEAIPVLIENLDRPLDTDALRAAYEAIRAWGWQAEGPLKRGLASPRFAVRLDCARLLVERCRYQAGYMKAPPLRAVMYRLAKGDDDPALRRVGIEGLWDLTKNVTNYPIDGLHVVGPPYDPVGLRGLIDLAFDREAGYAAVERLAYVAGLAGSETGFRVPPGWPDRSALEKVEQATKVKLADPDPVVRAAAVAVANTCFSDAALARGFERDPDSLVRFAATHASGGPPLETSLGANLDWRRVPDVVRDARSPQWKVRRLSALRIRQILDGLRPGPPSLRAALVLLARDDFPAVRRASLDGLFRLAQHTQPEPSISTAYSEGPYDLVALRPILDLAFDRDEDIARYALDRLAFLACGRTGRSLATALRDKEPAVRAAALAIGMGSTESETWNVLKAPRAPRAAGALAAMADDHALVRLVARRILRGGGDEGAGPRLVPLLRDPRAGVRRDALGALADLRYPATLASLLKDSDPEVRRAAVHALRVFRGDYLRAKQTRPSRLVSNLLSGIECASLATAFRSEPASGRVDLATARRLAPRKRSQATRTLYRLPRCKENSQQGAEDAMRVARTMDLRADDPWLEPDLTAGLTADDAPEMVRLLSVVRRDITFRTLAGALRRLKRREAIPVLIGNLDRPLQAAQNRAALHALEAWSWEAVPDLLEGLASPRRGVRLDCARLLVGQCQQQRSLKNPPLRPVMRRLAQSDEAAMREIALDGLWRLGGATHDWPMDGVHHFEAVCDRPSMAGVIDLAFDRDPVVRRAAVGRLAFMLGIAGNENEFDVFESTASKAVVERVPKFLKSPDPLFRAAAVAVWRNHYGPGATYPENDPDPLVRRAATFGPSQLGYVPPPTERQDLQNPSGLVRLVDDSNPRTRAAAAGRLRRIVGYFRPARPEVRAALARLARDEEPTVRRASLDGLFRVAQRTRHDRNGDAHFSSGPYDPVALRSVIDLSYDFYPEVYGPARAHLAFLAHLLPRETDPFRRLDEALLAKTMAHREPAVRAAAVALAFASSRPMLGRRGMADDDPLVRYAARLGLRPSWPSMTGGEDDRKLADLLALLRDDRSGVRQDAVGALVDAWRPATVPRLLPLLRDSDPEVRAAAGHAVRALRGDYLLPRAR